uniref:Uncharacterized protein n=1 Tax=Sphaerodactylus townsendi TaxID=933632 RepID=A0ACB8EM88_9SAUR
MDDSGIIRRRRLQAGASAPAPGGDASLSAADAQTGAEAPRFSGTLCAISSSALALLRPAFLGMSVSLGT